MSKVITPVMANDIARSYDLTSRKIDNFTHNSGYFNKRVRKDDTKGIRELEHAERAVRALYQAMREAMSVRAEFMLQAQAQKIETALESLVKQQEEELSNICKERLSLKLDEAIITDFRRNMSSNTPVLPEKFFEISEVIKQRSVKNKEVVGTKEETENGSCYSSKRTVDEKEIVEYSDLSLPDADTMARQWSNGIDKDKQNLWDILCNWIIEGLSRASDAFDKSVNDVINLAERALQEQLRIIEENFATEMQRWSHLEFQKASATTVRQQLEKESCLSNNI